MRKLPPPIRERFLELARQVAAYGLPDTRAWILNNWRQAASPEHGNRIFRYWSAIALASGVDPAARVCLDAGCGAGLLAVILSLAGARRVVAVDILPDAVQVVRQVARLGDLTNIEVEEGDIARLPPEWGPFDLAYSIEAISHYRDYQGFLRLMYDLLAPGGVLIIRDANNGANPATVRRTREVWRAVEYGHPAGRCHGHTCPPGGFLSLRRDIIRATLPSLSEEQVDQYARWTFGYNRDKIAETARRFAAGDLSLRSEFRPDVCPLDPRTDWFCEQLFDPYHLAAELREIGFRPRVHAHLTDRYPLADAIWGWLSPLTVRWSKAFVITARKA